MKNDDYLELMGARIRSELNDLKRTPQAAAEELRIDVEKINNIIKGNCNLEDIHALINKMEMIYPIDSSDLHIPLDDCSNGIKIMRAEESRNSSRIFTRFTRKDKNNDRSPYYEYRDTAMSRLSPFKPEWIKELRVVKDSDPESPDVVYNNGHFLHQMTFFIGPVNFYWEVNGKKHSREMSTGDSNYITPFHRHSFSSRDKSKDAIIIAVTFGGDVRRAQKELYVLGDGRINDLSINYRDHNEAVIQLIQQHIRNENLSLLNLEERINSMNLNLSADLEILLNKDKAISNLDREIIAKALNIESSDLMIPLYNPAEEVVVKGKDKGYLYPEDKKQVYKIHQLARTSKMPLMKGFDIEVLEKSMNANYDFKSSLHYYFYNYGKTDVELDWEINNHGYKEVIHNDDSVYVQPLVKYSFSNSEDKHGKILAIGVSGAINLSTQKELSYFSDLRRVARETKQWFD
ncbi:MAG: hypothetical protein AABW56_02930 [Nanoarchaeota archaeon]